MLWRLLCLLCLCSGHGALATSVHEVAISVQSIKSIVYRGMQVPIFEHTQMPRRYFFQPLSFLNCSSARLTDNAELKMTQLHFDIHLWTTEFIQLVESHFVDHKSVEMLPLTEISLTWSKQASLWLGADFNRTYRLLDDWKDGDKPHMRNTFTVFCKKREACERLLEKFNQSDEAIAHLFYLRYKVQGDSTRNVSLTVGSSHFLQSSAFQLLDRFASQRPGDNQVIVSGQVIDDLAEQVFTAALGELQQLFEQQVTYVDANSRREVLVELHRFLRSDPVFSPSKMQWENQVFWQHDRLALRPDKLSIIFNVLFRPASQPLHVTLPRPGDLAEASESIPKSEFDKIDAFVRLHANHHKTAGAPTVHVEYVCSLASDLGSRVTWDAAKGTFAPSASLTLFLVDLRKVQKVGFVLVHGLTAHFKVSLHVDPVHPLPTDTEFQNSLWQRQFARSFCVLANRGEPPDMQCRVLSYLLPTRSLQRDTGNQLDSFTARVKYQGGHIGQSHLYQVNPSEFSFSLKICCTKDLEMP